MPRSQGRLPGGGGDCAGQQGWGWVGPRLREQRDSSPWWGRQACLQRAALPAGWAVTGGAREAAGSAGPGTPYRGAGFSSAGGRAVEGFSPRCVRSDRSHHFWYQLLY